MNDKELNKNVKKSLENFIKELATNPEKVFDNDKLQIKYNNVLKEKIKLQSNWNSLRELIEKEKTRLAKECSHTYEDSLGKTKLVNEDIFNELNKISDKMNELESGEKNNENNNI